MNTNKSVLDKKKWLNTWNAMIKWRVSELWDVSSHFVWFFFFFPLVFSKRSVYFYTLFCICAYHSILVCMFSSCGSFVSVRLSRRDAMRTTEVSWNKTETFWQQWIGAQKKKSIVRRKEKCCLTPASYLTLHMCLARSCRLSDWDIFNARHKWNAGLIVSGYNLGARQMLMWGVKGASVGFFFSLFPLRSGSLRHFCCAVEQRASLLFLYL